MLLVDARAVVDNGHQEAQQLVGFFLRHLRARRLAHGRGLAGHIQHAECAHIDHLHADVLDHVRHAVACIEVLRTQCADRVLQEVLVLHCQREIGSSDGLGDLQVDLVDALDTHQTQTIAHAGGVNLLHANLHVQLDLNGLRNVGDIHLVARGGIPHGGDVPR